MVQDVLCTMHHFSLYHECRMLGRERPQSFDIRERPGHCAGMKTPDKGDMQGGGMRLTAFAAEDRFRARPRLSQRPRLDLSIIEGLE